MRSRRLTAVASCLLGIAGVITLFTGMSLRFHTENTEEAMAAEARGALWLLAAALLFLAAAIGAKQSQSAAWAVALIATPLVLGVAPALLLPGNIIPFATALLSVLLALTGLTATLFRR